MTYEGKHDYKVEGMSQSCWHKSVSVVKRSGVESNHADKNINKSKKWNEMEREKGSGLGLSEGDAWNITTYELVPNFYRDLFIIGYHIPQKVGWRRGQDGGQR